MRQLPVPRFRSPLRGPWLTSVFATVLLVGMPIVIVTGLLSYAAYEPRLAGNDTTAGAGLLRFYLFAWPTSPSWIYRLTQGVHVTLALVLIPVVLAKLWSVIPRLFVFPPVKSVAQALERISLLALVGGILFEIITGVLNIQSDYVFGFSFYTAHLYGAWVFIAGFVVHVGIKLPTMLRSLRTRRLRDELHVPASATEPELTGLGIDDDLVARDPAPATMSRRALAGVVAGAAALVGGLSIGQTLGGPLRRTALLSPRGRSYGSRPTDFQINKTAATAGVMPAATDTAWRLAPGPVAPRPSPAPSCWPWPSTATSCRSLASRGGRRCRRGPGSGWVTSPPWSAPAASRCTCSPSSAAASGPSPCPRGRPATTQRCWR